MPSCGSGWMLWLHCAYLRLGDGPGSSKLETRKPKNHMKPKSEAEASHFVNALGLTFQICTTIVWRNVFYLETLICSHSNGPTGPMATVIKGPLVLFLMTWQTHFYLSGRPSHHKPCFYAYTNHISDKSERLFEKLPFRCKSSVCDSFLFVSVRLDPVWFGKVRWRLL